MAAVARLFACLLLVACSNRSGDADPTPGAARTRVVDPGPLAIDAGQFLAWVRTAAPSAPVFEVDQRVVTAGYFQLVEQRLAGAPDDQVAERLKHSLDERIRAATLRAVADARGLEAKSAVVGELERDLAGSAPELTAAQVTELARERALVRALVDDAGTPTDAELERWLAVNPDGFRYEDAVHIDGILVSPAKQNDAAAKRDARDRAARLADELREVDEEAFRVRAEQLMTHSWKPPSGWLERSRLPAALGEAIEHAAAGSLVGPIETPQGFALFRVNHRVVGGTPPLATIRARALDAWRDAHRNIDTALYARALTDHEVWWLL